MTDKDCELALDKSQFACHFRQSLVTGPQSGIHGQGDRCQQMGIDVADSLSHELMMLNKVEHFFMTGLGQRMETVPEFQQ